MSPFLIVMPTNECDIKYAFAPDGMSHHEAKTLVESFIGAANREDAANADDNGGCDDGLCVEDSINRRMGEAGFIFPEVVTTVAWDKEFVEPEFSSFLGGPVR